MGYLLIFGSYVSMLLICLSTIFVLYLLKPPWFKGIAGEFRLELDDETQSAFIDSWENGLEQNDDNQFSFTDRAFR